MPQITETPILDLKQDPPNVHDVRLALVSVAVLLFITVPLFVRRASISRWLWLPSFFAAIAIHEFGHLAGAWLAGMTPEAIIISGVEVYRKGTRWQWRFDWRSIGGGLFRPCLSSGASRTAQWVGMVAGGPLSTILLAIA